VFRFLLNPDPLGRDTAAIPGGLERQTTAATDTAGRHDMSRLIASILLSILLFPLAAVLYLVTFIVLVETWIRRGDELGCLLAGVVTSTLVGWYWIAVWRKTVNWTKTRVARTFGASAAAVGAGAVAGLATGTLDQGFGYFIGSITPPLLWLVATVLVWRETDEERSARLRLQGRRGDGPAVPCPTCGYDMTGLRGTRCPECGCEFTVNEILAGQPGRAAVELER
jgi:hypothetical protein